jgi:hypothetical protein
MVISFVLSDRNAASRSAEMAVLMMHVRSTGTDAELHVTIDPRYIAQPDMSAVLANALLQRAFPTCWEAPARTRFTAS